MKITRAVAVMMSLSVVTPLCAIQAQPPAADLERLKERQAMLAAFNTLTPEQQAAAWQRRIQWCLDNLTLTEEQRSVVIENLATIRPENYRRNLTGRDLEEQQAARQKLKPLHDRTELVLGRQLYLEVFYRGPSLADIEAVRKDPSIR